MEALSTTADRVEFLEEQYDLTKRNAQALILAELGYSASGIAQELAVTEGTARKYIARLEDRIGEGVTESLPKDNRYSTFPGDTVHSDEPQVFSDVIDIPPINKGVELSEIGAEQMSAPESYEGQNA